MENSSLDRLIIENIGDLDAGTRRLWEIEGLVADAIDTVKSDWAKKVGWEAGADDWANDDCTVALPAWRPSPEEWWACFELWYGDGDGEPGTLTDSFWLTRLCGEGQGQIGFRFVQEEFGAVPWRKFLREKTTLLSGTRFILDDKPSFFLPFKVDKNALAIAVENEDIASALQPMRDALDYILEHHEKFDGLLAEMRGREAAKAPSALPPETTGS